VNFRDYLEERGDDITEPEKLFVYPDLPGFRYCMTLSDSRSIPRNTGLLVCPRLPPDPLFNHAPPDASSYASGVHSTICWVEGRSTKATRMATQRINTNEGESWMVDSFGAVPDVECMEESIPRSSDKE